MGWLQVVGIIALCFLGIGVLSLLIMIVLVITSGRAEQEHPDIRLVHQPRIGWGYIAADPFSGNTHIVNGFRTRRQAYEAAERHRSSVAVRLHEEFESITKGES